MTIYLGRLAFERYLGSSHDGLAAAAQDFERLFPGRVVLPHPSPRNVIWLKKNSWFATIQAEYSPGFIGRMSSKKPTMWFVCWPMRLETTGGAMLLLKATLFVARALHLRCIKRASAAQRAAS